ncbi:transcription termination/antitermination factor NusG [Candidatus Berkelbacteria bacterium]|nr:transcription termination/antitermination factor NusG [Candidatus Berkelbacteria bacterium]MBI4029663.1 transcription termination/antitermination factor NusG [Candidatus Berkelbacteria bacterium]
MTEEKIEEIKPKAKKPTLKKQRGERGWYVIHTHSGFEDQVAENLKQRIQTFGMQDMIFNVVVPKEKEVVIKDGKKQVLDKKVFSGYVLVEMIVTDDSWYVVRNTPKVTGFIGLGVHPTAMQEEEVKKLLSKMQEDEPKYKIEFIEGDLVRINDGPLRGFEGKVEQVDEEKGKVKVVISMFGRETPLTLDYLQVKKM